MTMTKHDRYNTSPLLKALEFRSYEGDEESGYTMNVYSRIVLGLDGELTVVETKPRGNLIANNWLMYMELDGLISTLEPLRLLQEIDTRVIKSRTFYAELIDIPEEYAYVEYDLERPVPFIEVVQIKPEKRRLYGGNLELITIGPHPACDALVDRFDGMGDVYAILVWKNGALWISSGDGQKKGTFRKFPLPTEPRTQHRLVDPGAIFQLGEASLKIQFPSSEPRRHSPMRSIVLQEEKGSDHDIVIAPSTVRTIGRASGNDFVINDRSVDDRHARLEYGAYGLKVEDLGSRRGTFVDGKDIRYPQKHALGELLKYVRPGSRIRFGTVEYVLVELLNGIVHEEF